MAKMTTRQTKANRRFHTYLLKMCILCIQHVRDDFYYSASALLTMQTDVLAIGYLSVCLSFCH